MLELLEKTVDGQYLDPDGITHESEADYLLSCFGFCPCGFPMDVLEYVLAMMQRIAKGITSDDYDKPDGFALQFFCKWADGHGFVTHGGTTLFPIMEERGKILIKDLKKVLAENSTEAP